MCGLGLGALLLVLVSRTCLLGTARGFFAGVGGVRRLWKKHFFSGGELLNSAREKRAGVRRWFGEREREREKREERERERERER